MLNHPCFCCQIFQKSDISVDVDGSPVPQTHNPFDLHSAPPLLFALVRLLGLLLALHPCGMLSPHLINEDHLPPYDFSLEFLATFNFGIAFGFDGKGNAHCLVSNHTSVLSNL
jgi:hypothetical protein